MGAVLFDDIGKAEQDGPASDTSTAVKGNICIHRSARCADRRYVARGSMSADGGSTTTWVTMRAAGSMTTASTSPRYPSLQMASLPSVSVTTASLLVLRTLTSAGYCVKSTRITTRRGLGRLTSVKPASAKTWRLPTYSSPQVISLPGWVIIGYASRARAPFPLA
jgi:hypothetical protein